MPAIYDQHALPSGLWRRLPVARCSAMSNFKTATNWIKDFFVRVISSKIDMKC